MTKETDIYADNDSEYYDIETDTRFFDDSLYTTSDMEVFIDRANDTVVIRQFYPEEEYRIPKRIFRRLKLMIQKEIVQAERDRWATQMIRLKTGLLMLEKENK